ncbi:ferredoxin reductase domain-containing protein [Angustibacter aerolatus]
MPDLSDGTIGTWAVAGRHHGLALLDPPRTAAAEPAAPGRLRALTAHPLLMPYHRLTAAVLALNAALAVWWVPGEPAARAGQLASADFVLAFAVRQQPLVNALFRLALRSPHRWPLRRRWHLAKVYHHGGVHVGASVAGSAWSLVLAVATTRTGAAWPVLAVTWTLVALLVAVCVLAAPAVRHRRHDLFEMSHRYGGWSALLLLWAQALLTGHAVWVLVLLTVLVAVPWLRLRRVPVQVERPSGHLAVLTLADGTRPTPGAYTALSRHPLGQWHGFALVPSPGEAAFRVMVSRAGDWTSSLIDAPPRHVWVKGVPTSGMATVAGMFRSVLWVATGSGIAPVLPHLLARSGESHLLWVGRRPRETYGDELLSEITGAVGGLTLWDTTTQGKPDVTDLARRLRRETGAEAVVVISNKALTWPVVHRLSAEGVPTFGAIWDS